MLLYFVFHLVATGSKWNLTTFTPKNNHLVDSASPLKTSDDVVTDLCVSQCVCLLL